MVVQGDTLSTKLRAAREVAVELQRFVDEAAIPADSDVLWASQEITDWLFGLLRHYQAVLTASGEDLPFHPPLSEDSYLDIKPTGQ